MASKLMFSQGHMPLVSIGMPVRNGGALFREALASVVAQDYTNLEIIVSDNASTDETADIVREFQQRDPRIRYVRHEKMLRAFQNFRFVLDEARGDFFCWAAHDDTRSPDFISGMIPAFREEATILVFPDLFVRSVERGPLVQRKYDFENSQHSSLARMRKQVMMQCFHIYGLWRTRPIRELRWFYVSWWPDMPIMAALAYRGIFKYVAGPRFQYLEIAKTAEERAQYQDAASTASNVENVIRLAITCFRSLNAVAGLVPAMAAFFFVIEKYAYEVVKKYSGVTRRARN
jgi:glycosyltransferase involved in cell wall biosynthesis